jgi:hypothetical protein
MRTRAKACQWSVVGSPSFQRSPFARDVFFDPGRAVVPRITALLILRSTITTVSAPAMRQFRGSIDTPCNCCVRFVAVVTAGSRNTHYRATRYGLTRAGLSPAGLRQPYWRLRLCCPDPSSLIRPHPPRSQEHRNFTARRLICDVFAVRECLGDPRAVPGFCWPIFPDMPSPTTPGSSTSISSRYRRRHRPSPKEQRLGTPNVPAIRFARGEDFVASTVRIFATACQVARHPVRI